MKQLKLFNDEEIAQFSVGDRVRIKNDYIDGIYSDYFDDDYDEDECDNDAYYAHMAYLDGVFVIIRVNKVFKMHTKTFSRYEYHVESDLDMWFFAKEIEGV